MSTNRDIALNIIGDIADFQKKMAQIPGVTERAAGRAAMRLQKDLTQAQKAAAREAERAAKRGADAWATVGKAAAGALTVGAIKETVMWVASLGQATADLRNELTDTSARTALQTDTLAGLRLAAEGAGTSLSAMESGLKSLPKRMADAQRGAGDAARVWKEWGLEVEDGNGKLRSADDVFRESWAHLQGITDETERAAAGNAIFGESYGALAQSVGDVPLEAFIDQARTLGLDVGPENAKAAGQWQRSMAELKGAVAGASAELVELLDLGGRTDAFVLGFVYMKEVVIGGLRDITENVGRMADMYKKFYTGDFRGAHAAFVELRKAGDDNADSAKEVARQFYEARKAIREAAEANKGHAGAAGDNEGAQRGLTEAARELREELERQTAELRMAQQLWQIEQRALQDTWSAERKLREERAAALDQIGRLAAAGADAAEVDAAATAVKERHERELAKLREKEADKERERQEEWLETERRVHEEADRLVASGAELRLEAYEELHEKASFVYDQISAAAGALLDAEMNRITALLGRDQGAVDERIANRDALQQQALAQTDEEARAAIQAQADKLTAEIKAGEQIQSRRRRAAMRVFRGQQLASMGEIAMNTSAAVLRAFALFGPPPSPGGIAAAGTAVATGGIQAGLVAAQQPPQFHIGFPGFTSDPREVNARLLPEEAVLNPRATAAMGREEIDRRNATGSAGGGGTTELVGSIEWQGRPIARVVARQVERGQGGSLSTRLRRAEGPRGIRSIYGGR